MMKEAEPSTFHYQFEAAMILRALDCDLEAVGKVLKYLTSANPRLCQTMQAAIREVGERRLWRQLLIILASRRWNGDLAQDWHLDERAIARGDQAITEVFLQASEDRSKTEVKRAVLKDALKDPETVNRWAAAYVLGLRGDSQSVPILAEIIETGSKTWRLRAIKALGAIQDQQAGPPLIQALAQNRNRIHREARRALQNLGQLAAPAWIDALDHPDSHIRWHAARGLGEIGDPRAASILAEGLADENYAVRWATADVLANLGASAVPATLKMLCHHPLTESFRQAAYHALNGIRSPRLRARLRPLLEALRGPAPVIGAPSIAQRLLLEWEKPHDTQASP